MSRKMNLFAYLKTGPTALHPAGWRHPEATLGDILKPSRYENIARTLEDACFDGCFFADLQGLYDIHAGGYDAYVRYGGQVSYLDPMTILPVMAAATRYLGLGATLSTTLLPAYHLARSLQSLDVMSGGRVAWNIVTSATELEARNYGLASLPDKDLRYDQADEVVEACMKLWKSWDEDAWVLDKERGIFGDPAKVHYANYEGRFVRTRGPITIPRSAQGHPVLMQAGSSPRGTEFAARWAELVFTFYAPREKARAHYDALKQKIVENGRRPGDCAVAMLATCIVGETDSIAREKADYINSLVVGELNAAHLSASAGVDVTKLSDKDKPGSEAGAQGMHAIIEDVSELQKTAKTEFLAAARKMLPEQIVGSPKTVADRLEDIFTSGCCDGFVLDPVTAPSSHETFARAVVPELQRRGLFRTQYEAPTLRGNIGTRPGR
ncbi:NtaA/DmoA family FMN-dependent monooxygenase [Acetobacter sp. TBRC 12305]|uniref:NtaA/DmoA family FMN-dependent monooxygenase n=1 Tax=Acetobacter garciniae TaxID=2817435 RepID=A0A939KMV0_9PROT|nr:NtaA/DmoA family FMN-dependent monooxygenase [Acetobacter garciniae]MBO1324955.1 NtaA/DmoA family FMN-dependent monooxygenase [Acetobacter garciniae]MBX0344646.1 NtaA/DmoA family FMN-dependent monooxygenase [Acetobacter garciniae]